jgi:hypothetical protein
VNSHRRFNLRAVLIASAAVLLAFAGLGAFSFTRSTHRTRNAHVPYTQQLSFGYEGSAPSSPVYPTGTVRTGDPIFLQFVHQLRVQVAYNLDAAAPARISGTQQVVLRLTGPTGWTREQALTPFKHFNGDRFSTTATLDLNAIQTLVKQIQKLTGVSITSGYTIAVVPRVHVLGTVAGQTAAGAFEPALTFKLAPPQLRPAGSFSATEHGTVVTTSSTTNGVTVASVFVTVKTLRLVALAGFLLVLLEAVLVAVLVKRGEPFGEAGRIQAQYGHLIVPIAGTAEDLAWAPFDVPNIESLVRLAEACDRLILHYREDTLDTYLVNDEGTVYRYQSRHSGVVWGEWSTAPVAKLDSVPPPAVAKEAA